MIKSMYEVEKEAILSALALCGGNALAAAKELKIGKTTLYRKLCEYKVPRVPYARHPPLPSLIVQAAALQTPAVSFGNGDSHPVISILLLPSTRVELMQANLECPRCHSRLLAGRK